MKETIGVVVATYNGEKYIEEQLHSIINQTRKPDLIVLSDGGSTDCTVAVAKHVLAKGKVKYSVLESGERLNILENFQKGLESCNTDIVFFSDQDDVWYKNKIDAFYQEFMGNRETVLVFSNADIVDESLSKTGTTLWKMIRFTPGKIEDIKYEMIKRNIFTGMCMAIRKKWADTLPSFPQSMFHDEFYGWSASVKNRAVYLNMALAAYRQHANNVVGSGKYTRFQSKKQAREKIVKSTSKTARKFEDIEKILLGSDEALIRQINKAKSFHVNRLRLYHVHGIKAILCFSVYAIKGNYSKYCSKTERAFMKDLFCAMFR